MNGVSVAMRDKEKKLMGLGLAKTHSPNFEKSPIIYD